MAAKNSPFFVHVPEWKAGQTVEFIVIQFSMKPYSGTGELNLVTTEGSLKTKKITEKELSTP
jgi:hypothetical protein